MVYKIMDIHEEDGFYNVRNTFIGKSGTLIGNACISAISPNLQECKIDLGEAVVVFFIGVRLFPNPLEEL